ncbi:Mobile element protein [Salmonella enterica subsp. enterica serovar Senftenberg]|nr:bacteriophage integrase [Salmonella enterica subsp. enterica serovar Senftenberg str. ATCC 8400]SQI14684.1 Mobile element protein [Salmonella enterica subsp. enterica serovar Senftenberg]
MLTDSKIRTAKPLAKPYKITDSQGLYLTVSASGSKLWYFRYRFEGKENRLAFGPYPQVTLAEAREKRDAARKLLVSGICPSLMPVSVKERNGVRAAYVHGGAYGDDAVVVRLSGREPRGGRCALYLCPAT